MEFELYKLLYEIKKDDVNIRILGKEFVKANKNKGKIVYKNKIYPLLGLFQLLYNIKGTLKIKMIISKNIHNKSFMFKDCYSLTHIKFHNEIYNRKDILFNGENNLYVSIPEIFQSRNIVPNNKNKVNDYLEWNTKISAMNEMFSNCSSLISLPDISNLDTSNVFDMSKLFYKCKSLSFIPDISNWDTSNVTDMNKMFYKCISLSLLTDISKWNTFNMNNMDDMFSECSSLTSLPSLIKWKNKSDNLEFNIKNCISLQNLIDTSRRNINMSSMFEKSASIFKLIYEIKDENILKIFDSEFVLKNQKKCKIIINNKIYPLKDEYEILDDNLKMLKIKLIILNNTKIDLSYMFYDCMELKKFYVLPPQSENELKEEKINLKNENENINKLDDLNNQLYNPLNYSDKSDLKLEEMNKNKYIKESSIYKNKLHIIFPVNINNSYDEGVKIDQILNESHNFLFSSTSFHQSNIKNNNINGYNSINEDSFLLTNSTIINFNDNSYKNKTLYEHFYSLKLSLSNSYKNNTIIPTDLSYMFSGCSSIISISGINKWDTINVINMSHMFNECSSLQNIIDMSLWKTNYINDISYMFSDCSSLVSLPDISNWDTNYLENMRGVFYNCSSLKLLPDISK